VAGPRWTPSEDQRTGRALSVLAHQADRPSFAPAAHGRSPAALTLLPSRLTLSRPDAGGGQHAAKGRWEMAGSAERPAAHHPTVTATRPSTAS
jgi:hypothetical protein